MNQDKSADECFEKGRELLDRGYVRASLEPLQQAIRLRPDFDEARLFLAQALIRMGEDEAAQTEIQQLPPGMRNHPLIDCAYGKFHALRGEYDKAIEIYAALAGSHPREPFFLLLLGRTLGDAKRHREAIPVLEQALALAQGDRELVPRIAAALILPYDEIGEKQKALEMAKLANPLFEEAKRAAKQAAEQAVPGGPPIGELMDEAEKHEHDARTVFLDAVKLWETGQTNAALERCQRAVDLTHGSAAGPHALLGQLLWDKQRWAEAAEAYRKATEIDPGHIVWLAWRGGAETRAGAVSEGIAHLRQARDRAEASNDHALCPPEQRCLLAEALIAQGAAAEAEETIRQILPYVIRREDDFAQAHVLCLLGQSLVAQNKEDEAKVAFNAALEKNPKSGETWGQAARLACVAGRYVEACTCLQHALQNGYMAVPMLMDAASMMERRQQPDTALRYYLLAQCQAPEDQSLLNKTIALQQLHGVKTATLWGSYFDVVRYFKNVRSMRDIVSDLGARSSIPWGLYVAGDYVAYGISDSGTPLAFFFPSGGPNPIQQDPGRARAVLAAGKTNVPVAAEHIRMSAGTGPRTDCRTIDLRRLQSAKKGFVHRRDGHRDVFSVPVNVLRGSPSGLSDEERDVLATLCGAPADLVAFLDLVGADACSFSFPSLEAVKPLVGKTWAGNVVALWVIREGESPTVEFDLGGSNAASRQLDRLAVVMGDLHPAPPA